MGQVRWPLCRVGHGRTTRPDPDFRTGWMAQGWPRPGRLPRRSDQRGTTVQPGDPVVAVREAGVSYRTGDQLGLSPDDQLAADVEDGQQHGNARGRRAVESEVEARLAKRGDDEGAAPLQGGVRLG